MNRCTAHNKKGAALMIFIIFFMFGSIAASLFVSQSVFSAARNYNLISAAKQGYLSSEILAEDMAYRTIASLSVDETETNTFYGATVAATSTFDSVAEELQISTESHLGGTERNVYMVLTLGSGTSFSFGLQSGNGGIHMDNNSSILGNIFSNGAVTGTNSATAYGDVISAGPTGLVSGFYATGSVYAHNISNMDIDGDAHYVNDSASVVLGTRYYSAADQATASMPISDESIQEWEDYLTASGTVIASTSPQCSGGTYVINSNATLGDVIIECNLEVQKNSTTLTLTGAVWVKGNIVFDQGPTITIDSGVGARTVQFFADNPTNRATSSQIQINNSTQFSGSGVPKSYVLLLSMNESAELGGSEFAIDLNQAAQGDVIVYASHGLVTMGNNIGLKEVTAYQIDISNGSQVVYESGLASLLFTSGPGGGYTFSDWREIE